MVGADLYSSIFYYFTNIYNFILFITPVLCVLYLMLGGIKVITSAGNTERLKIAKATILNAVIGCFIVIFAYPILNIIGLTIPSTNIFLDWYGATVTLVAAGYLAYGGILYITSAGNTERLLEAKDRINHALMGYLWMLGIKVIFLVLTSARP